MENEKRTFTTIDEYIAAAPEETREKLNSLRAMIREEVPDAGEKISYGMPTFTLHGNLVHFALQKKHMGFYPAPSGVATFAEELSGYKTSKGAVQFPLSEPLPLELIRRIVRFRAEENRAAAHAKQEKN